MDDLGAIGKSVQGRSMASARIVFPPTVTIRAGGGVFMPFRNPPAMTMRRMDRLWRAILTPPWWGGRPIGSLPMPNSYIEGHVYQRGEDDVDVPIGRCRVRLYYRPNGALIANAITDAAGHYRFENLMPEANAYYAVAFDPDSPPAQNSLVLDRLSSSV